MKRLIICTLAFTFFYLHNTQAQNIGLGTTNPQSGVHIFERSLLLEGTNRYLDFKPTNGSNNIYLGLRYLKNDGGLMGGQFFHFGNNSINMSNSPNANGLVHLLSTNQFFIGRDEHISTQERFGIRKQVTGDNYGGMYMETAGSATAKPFYGYAMDGASKAWHYFDGDTDSWRLYNGGDRLVIKSNGNIGMGKVNPIYKLDILANNLRGINIENEYDGSAAKFGARFEATSEGTGYKYGLYALAHGGSGSSFNYGGRFLASAGAGNIGNAYGVYAQVSSSGTGNHYGVYTTANLSDPAPGKKSWAMYAQGNSYFSHDVRIGTINGANGYKLSVAGKIISEEVKVQLTQNWPDYVFDKEYDLKPLDEVEQFIEKNHHLPGVPSAAKVKSESGIELGEMNRILLEKVEELTLHIIRQQKEIDALKNSKD